MSSTLCAQASKSLDGSYAYDTFVIPFSAESLKCVVSIALECGTGVSLKGRELKVQRFLTFSIPAACYFVSNMLYVIRELAGVTFQVTNNLKILSTGLLMRLFLGRKLTWLHWKALNEGVLAVGCAVTQFKSCARDDATISLDQNFIRQALGYAMVFLNPFASQAESSLKRY